MQSRNKIKLFFNPEDYELSSELIVALCLPESFVSKSNNSLLQTDNRFRTTKGFCKKYFTWCDDIKVCDFVLYPRKFTDSHNPLFNRYLSLAKKHYKKLLGFQIDDSWKSNGFDDDLILYKTSIDKSNKGINVRSMPAFIEDKFDYTFQHGDRKPSLGFCGHQQNGRHVFLTALRYSEFKTNFIIREGFWAPEIHDRKKAARDFDNNIRSNLFNFCHKGAGNFSYRFYEVMMHCRLPFIINTHCMFPFSDRWKLGDIGFVFEGTDTILMLSDYKNYLKSKFSDFLRQQVTNRNIFESFFSPDGFLFNLYLDLKTDIQKYG